jgi:NodT family efflux transporter outer membrane factor (OMF) lipoprotein
MNSSLRCVAAITVASVLLTACAVTHVDPPAPAAAPPAYKEAGLWQRATPDAAAVPDDWWTLFNDPTLNDLQKRLIIGNENLKQAVAQITTARAQLDASHSAMFPTLGLGVQGTKPDDTGDSGHKHVQIDVLATSTWEIDLWGRLREQSAGAKASLQASADDLAAARLSAQATLTQTYFSLRATDAQLTLLERSVAAYQRSRDLTQVRYEDGVAARSEVLQATTQLKATQAQLADTVATRAQLEHAIAVMLGVPPSSFALERSDVVPTVPVVPPMLPSTLLQRRPDIAAAERRVAAAYSQIGVADAAYFPTLSLSAGAGFAISSLSNTPKFVWSIGPQIAEAIFDGGQRRLASAQARANADQATSSYRQSVLTALQEVEDNLVLAAQLQQEADLQLEALQAAQHGLQITQDQYKSGSVSFLNVLISQNSALTSESTLLGVRNRQLSAVNQLLKNIAGRWDIEPK